MSEIVNQTIIKKPDDKKIGQIDKLRTLSLLEDFTRQIKNLKHQDLEGMPPLYRFDRVEEGEKDGQKW